MSGPALVTADQLGALVGLSARGVRDLAAQGIIPRAPEPGKYPFAASVKGYVAHLREVAAGRGTGEQLPALTAERLREAKERADKIALANAKARGEMVPAAEVERAWTGTLREVRAAMLAVPSRVAQRLPHLTRTDVAAIDREVRDVLREAGDA
jgi:phage terminase Nu1 subunit (DNA packaging protein)